MTYTVNEKVPLFNLFAAFLINVDEKARCPTMETSLEMDVSDSVNQRKLRPILDPKPPRL